MKHESSHIFGAARRKCEMTRVSLQLYSATIRKDNLILLVYVGWNRAVGSDVAA